MFYLTTDAIYCGLSLAGTLVFLVSAHYVSQRWTQTKGILGVIGVILLFVVAAIMHAWSRFAMLAAALALEAALSRQSLNWASPETLLSFGIYIVETVSVIGIQAIAFSHLMHVMPPGSGSWGLAYVGVPFAIQVLIYLVLEDLKRYWFHRLDHSSSFFWRFHSIHHGTRRLNYFTGGRDYPTFSVGHMLSDIGLAYLLGVSNEALVMGLTLQTFFAGFIAHANVDFPSLEKGFPWWGYLIVTPNFHAWHHTSHCREDANLADVFPFWDLIFGTFEEPLGPPGEWQFGLKDTKGFPQSILGQLAYPFRRNLAGSEVEV